MPQQHHTIDYIELPAPDLASSKAFYSAAFGWTFNEYGSVYAGIRDANDESNEVGGLSAERREPPLVILFSDDLDATAAAIEAAGGKITVPAYDFPGGKRLHFTDPAGAELAVWAHATSAG